MRGFLRRCALPAKYIALCGVLALAMLAALAVELPPLYQNVRPATPQAYFSHPGGYLDINTANAAELELIEGVGPVKAQRIVEYREAHGPFAQCGRACAGGWHFAKNGVGSKRDGGCLTARVRLAGKRSVCLLWQKKTWKKCLSTVNSAGWQFNRRVLDLAKDKAVPLGEQLKFAGIYGSNLDEFFMVRVGSLYDRTLLKETAKENKTGMTPAQQIDAIMPAVRELQAHCDKIVAKLYDNIAQHGLQKVNFEKLSKKQEHFWKRYFLREIFPVLSPQIIDRGTRFRFCAAGKVMWAPCCMKRKAPRPCSALCR